MPLLPEQITFLLCTCFEQLLVMKILRSLQCVLYQLLQKSGVFKIEATGKKKTLDDCTELV